MQENTSAASPRLVAVVVAAVVAAFLAAFASAGGPDVAGAAGTTGSGGTSQMQPIQSEQATPEPRGADRDGDGRDCPKGEDGSGSGSGSGSSGSSGGSEPQAAPTQTAPETDV